MTEYEPGLVYKATVCGTPDVTVFRDAGGSRMPWTSGHLVGEHVLHYEEDVTDVRPLVVLDFGGEDGIHVAKFIASLRDGLGGDDANAIADQIEAQIKPPRIPEPGLWGVVQDANANLYVRWAPDQWRALGARSYGAKWADIQSPVLVRDGIES